MKWRVWLAFAGKLLLHQELTCGRISEILGEFPNFTVDGLRNHLYIFRLSQMLLTGTRFLRLLVAVAVNCDLPVTSPVFACD
jgi:hypothetical protein